MSLMLMRVRTSIPEHKYQICRPPAAVCMPDLIYCRMTVCENERTTCTKVGMTFSELDVSLKVSHDECFRVKFEQDYKLMNFLSIYPLYFSSPSPPHF